MGAPRQHVRREVRIRVRLPANHGEIAGEVAQQNDPPSAAAAGALVGKKARPPPSSGAGREAGQRRAAVGRVE